MAGSTAQSPKDPLVAAWFALGLSCVLFVGTAAGLLGRLGGGNIAAAVLTGFGRSVGPSRWCC
jgi:hypothetical protein